MPSAENSPDTPQIVEAAIYDWKWYYSAGGLAPWLALILAFVVPKANRDLRVLLILVPLVIVSILWGRFVKFAGMNAVDEQQFNLMFHSMAVGVTVLWLIANYFVKFRGAVRVLFSLGTVVIIAGLSTLSYFGEFSDETAMFLALFIFMVLTMLTAMILSRRLCGGRYRPVCFMLWLALWTLLASMFATFGFFIVSSMIMSSGPHLSEVILMLTVAGLAFGLCLYVLNLPFMILGFVNPFFRERLCACLRLKSMAAPVVPGETENPGERPAGPEI